MGRMAFVRTSVCRPRDSDFGRAQVVRGDFVEIGGHFGKADVDEPVVCRARLDIAALTGEVAQRAGVEPKGIQRGQADGGASLAGCRTVRVLKLHGIQRCAGSSILHSHLAAFRGEPPNQDSYGVKCRVRSAEDNRKSPNRWDMPIANS
jgi:hypothetical protein